MLTTLREAFYFSRNQFHPLLMISLIYAIPSYFMDASLMFSAGEPDQTYLGVIMVASMCLSVIQFGAAMLYIDGVSHGRGISVGQAISRAVSQLIGLLALNILMGVIIGAGLLLLVLPGVFLAYKLLFAELYLLLHRQDPISALKSSFKATTGFSAELLPPILVWGSITVLASVLGSSLIDRTDSMAWLPLLVHQVLMIALSIFGWALIYRLYQRYLEGLVPDQS